MILSFLLFILCVPVDSMAGPYIAGNRKISREFLNLHGQPEQQEWSRNIKLQKAWRLAGSRYGQESPHSDSLRMEPFSTRNRDQTSSRYFGQSNHGFMINRNEHMIQNGAKFQSRTRKSLPKSYLPSLTQIRSDKQSHLAFHVPRYGTYKPRGSEGKRKQELIIKVGGDEIRISPNDYEMKDGNAEYKSALLTNEKINQPSPFFKKSYPVTPNAETYFAAPSANKEFYSSPTSKEPSPVPELSSASSVFETEYSRPGDSNLIGQRAYEHPVGHQSQETTNSTVRSLPAKSEDSEQNISEESWLPIRNSKNLNAKAHESRREVVINGRHQIKYGGRESTSKHSFPLSILDSQEEAADLQNGISEEQWKLYPPLLIEEINLPNVKDSSKMNVTGEILPQEAMINETVSNFKGHHSETTVRNHELDFFQISGFPDGSGDEEPLEEEPDSLTTDFLDVDSDEELIAGRKLILNSSQTPLLEQEGSGFESFENLREDQSFRDLSPRSIHLSAMANESSIPCTTPKGEPGYCRDIRYCILQEVSNNFNLYLHYVCLIGGRIVGICCPHNVISQTAELGWEN